MQSVHSFISEQRTNYQTKEIPLFSGMDFSMYDTLNQIDHYCANSYVEDAYDNVIGDYPFDNISKYRVLLEARATDFDTKHIEVESANGSLEARVSAMIASKVLRRHMQEIRFSSLLNDICITRPRTGGVLVKKNGEKVNVVPWANVIVDPTDIMSSPIIERHYYTPAEMYQQEGWENVEEAVEKAQTYKNKDISEQTDNRAETQGHFIEVFQTVGIVPKSMLLQAQRKEYDSEDNYTFVLAEIISCGEDWVDEEGQEDGVVLFASEIDEHIYKYNARNPITGRALGVGIVEDLFEHQKWHNFTKTEEMRMIAVAGKKVYVTDDEDVLENIFDEGIDHGTVLRVTEGKSITELNQIPTGTPVYQNMRVEWDDSASKTTSSFSAKIGEEAKSGTPFRAQYLQNVEASSQFEQYREEIGEDLIKPIVQEWLLPDAIKKAKRKDTLYDTFTMQELDLIDKAIVSRRTAEWFIEKTIKRELVTQEDIDEFQLDLQKELKKSAKRELKHISEFIENVPKNVVIHTTDESRNKAVYFESLANAIQLLAPDDPMRNAVKFKIFEAIGIPREELEMYAEQGLPTLQNPKLESKQLQQQANPTQRTTLPVTT